MKEYNKIDTIYERDKNESLEIVKHGQWTGDWDYVCSVCNESFEYMTNYCPNCGAKMEKGANDV